MKKIATIVETTTATTASITKTRLVAVACEKLLYWYDQISDQVTRHFQKIIIGRSRKSIQTRE